MIFPLLCHKIGNNSPALKNTPPYRSFSKLHLQNLEYKLHILKHVVELDVTWESIRPFPPTICCMCRGMGAHSVSNEWTASCTRIHLYFHATLMEFLWKHLWKYLQPFSDIVMPNQIVLGYIVLVMSFMKKQGKWPFSSFHVIEMNTLYWSKRQC